VVLGSKTTWAKSRQNPTSALLIVEVAETTLHDDRVRKGSLYAASGIPEYWIINLVNHVLEVHRNPQPDTSAEFGANYADVQSLTTDQSIAPVGMSDSVSIADLFPALQADDS
jgi:Uma2 family endonuclease